MACASQSTVEPMAARLKGAAMPYLKLIPTRGARGNGNAPALYQMSPDTEPNSQISGGTTIIAFHVSGAVDRCANCVGSHVEASLRFDSQMRPVRLSKLITNPSSIPTSVHF